MSNYKKYSSSNGLSTSEWGPSAWHFLFCSIMGSYPYKINKNDKEHIRIQKSFKCMLCALKYILPCCVCTESFKRYWNELPIDDHLVGRVELMRWLYLIKDQVNKKLLFQETEHFKMERTKLKLKTKNIHSEEYKMKVNRLKKKIIKTKKTIPFTDVLDYYESLRS